MKIGYRRVSSKDQNPDRQLEGISLDRVYTDFASGKSKNRPEFIKMMQDISPGDKLFIHSVDRLARNMRDMLTIVSTLVEKGIIVSFQKGDLLFTKKDNPMSNMLLGILATIAEFEWALIKERREEGIRLARLRGKYKSKHSDLIPQIHEMVSQGLHKKEISHRLNIPFSTVYWLIKQPLETETGPCDQSPRSK